MRPRLYATILFLIPAVSPGQQNTPAQAPPAVNPALFQQAAAALGPVNSPPNSAIKVSRKAPSKRAHTAATANPGPVITGTITALPEDKDVPLAPSSAYALSLAQKWLDGATRPTEGEDGRLLFTYGHGLPTIVAAPDKLTVIELERGEILGGEDSHQAGDSVRWKLTPYQIGAGDQASTYLVISPKFAGLDTNLTLFTNRRYYYLHLVSKPEAYMPRVSFTYPDEAARMKVEAIHANEMAEQQKRESEAIFHKADTQGPVRNTNYSFAVTHGKKDRVYFVPTSVWDDGVHTFIHFPDTARHRDVPTLQFSGAIGKDIPNNRFSEAENIYTVDGLFEQCDLITGVGRKQLKVTITNHGNTLATSRHPENGVPTSALQ